MRIAALFFLISFCHMSYAGGGGKVMMIMANSNGGNGAGVVMFKTESNTSKAACSTADSGTQWAFSLEKEHGRAMYSMLLSAQAQQKTVSVTGAGDCSAWADRERPSYIYITN